MLCKPYKLKDQAIRMFLTCSCSLQIEWVDRLNLVVILSLDK